MPAIPVHHTSTSNATWDAGKARRGYPNKESVLKYVSGWFDSNGDPDAKSTYKFPHHYTDGGPAILAGVRNGLARLPNAQVDDKDAIQAHLEAHLKDGGGGQDHLHDDGRLTMKKDPSVWKSVYEDWRKRLNNRTTLPEIKEIKNADEPNTLMIYDEIGYWGVTANHFISSLTDIKGDFTLRINSPGGDVFDGLAIYNAILAHDGFVTAQIDGLAASAASFICMACDHIVASDASMMMIHDAIGMAMGNASDMKKMMDLLDRSSQQIAGIYAKRAGNTMDYWRGLMKDEMWFTGTEAMDYGLADDTTDTSVIENSLLIPIVAKDSNEPPAAEPSRELVTMTKDTANLFKYAMADAIKEPDAPELPPFTLDPDVFKSVMIECTNNAPAVPILSNEPIPTSKPASTRVSLSDLADALREGLK